MKTCLVARLFRDLSVGSDIQSSTSRRKLAVYQSRAGVRV